MRKFSKKLIEDYIQGKEIEGYTIEELENDKDFMMQVIEVSNDKKIYNICSDNVKKDYEFVKYVVLKFKDDINFICNVADYYLEDVSDDLNRFEISIIMSNLTKNDKKNSDYCLIRDTIYTTMRVQIEGVKLANNDYDLQSFGMGFIVMLEYFKERKIVLNYCAKKTIQEIINEFDIDLEDLLHREFQSLDQINEVGINNYIINFIWYYDMALSKYLINHQDLMNDLNKEMNYIINNWDNYNCYDEREKYKLLVEKFCNFYEQIKENTIFTKTDLLFFAGKKLGILDNLIKYNILNGIILDCMDDDFLEDTIGVSDKDKIYFDIAIEVIETALYSSDLSGKDSNNKSKTKKNNTNQN